MIDILILAVVFIFYSPTFKFDLVVDDIYHYHMNRLRGGPGKGFRYLHWLKAVLYGGGTFGANKVIDHIFQTVLHGTVCTLIFHALGGDPVAFIAGLLYSVNPVNNQTAIWLNSRRYVVAIILMLLVLWKPYGLVFYLLIPVFHVNAILAPILFPFFHSVDFLYFLGLLVPLALTFKAGAIWNFVESRLGKVPDNELRRFKIQKIVLVVKTLGFYLVNCLLPTRKAFYYSYLQEFSLNKKGNDEAYSLDQKFWGYLLFLGLFFCILAHNLHNPIGWGMAAWLFFSLQWSNVVTLTQMFADRYMSLPNIFLMWALAYWIYSLPSPYDVVIFSSLMMMYMFQSLTVMRMYKNLEAFYNYHTYYHPENHEAAIHRATFLISMGGYIEALSVLKYSKTYNATGYKLHILMADCLTHLQPSRCEDALRVAEANLELGKKVMCLEQIQQVRDKLKRLK